MARELLGWEPEVSLKEGIASTVAWYKAWQESQQARRS
jgi:nucleoside-diphosphate-sugar epimerase